MEARILCFNTTVVESAHEVYSDSSFHSSEGRSLSLEDWQQMRTDVANLHNQLDRLDFSWTDHDQKDNNAMTSVIDGDSGNQSAAGETAV